MFKHDVKRRALHGSAATQGALAEAVGLTKYKIAKLYKAADAGDGMARLLIGMAALKAQRAVGGGLQVDLEDLLA